MNVRNDGDAHRNRATLPALGGGVALTAGLGVAAFFLWRTSVPPLHLPAIDVHAEFSAPELARVHRFRDVSRALFFGSLAVQVVVLAVLAWRGTAIAARLRPLARGRVRTAAALGLVAVVAVWLATLPFDGVFQWWERRYGLSRQGYAGWLGDEAVGLLVRAVLVAIAVALAVTFAARLGRRWWLAFAPVLAAAAVGFIVVQPLVVQPLLTPVHRLGNARLAAQLEAIAAGMGVHVSGVDVEDASAQTTAANAEAVGVGPSGRVILWDTLLDGRFSPAEIRVVAAHEFAHVERHHVWKGLAWFAILVVPGALLVAYVTARLGPDGLADPSLVPLGLFLAFAFFLATLPLQNAVSRRYEAEADWLALRATNDPSAMIGLQRGFVRTSLADPSPPASIRVVFGDHPSAMQRIEMAAAFREFRTARAARAGS